MDIISVKDIVNVKGDSKKKGTKIQEEDNFSQMLVALFANIKSNTDSKSIDINIGKTQEDSSVKELLSTIDSLTFSEGLHDKVKGSSEDDLNSLIEQLMQNTGNNKAAEDSSDIMNLVNNLGQQTDSLNEPSELSNILKLIENISENDFNKYFSIDKNDVIKNLINGHGNQDNNLISKIKDYLDTRTTQLTSSEGINEETVNKNLETSIMSQLMTVLNEDSKGTVNRSLKTTDVSKLKSEEKLNNLMDKSNVENKDINLLKTKNSAQHLKSNSDRILNSIEMALDNKMEVKDTKEELTIDGTNIKEVKHDASIGTLFDMQKLDTENKNIEAKEIVHITRPQDIIDVTVSKFKALKLPEITELKVKLRPEELGDITVKVVLEKGQINGSITAESRDVFNMIQNQMDGLKDALKNNNINLNNLSVNIGSGDGFSDRPSSGHFNEEQKRHNKNLSNFVTDDLDASDRETGFNIIA